MAGNNKIDLQVNQSTWKKSVDEMMKALQAKVKAAEDEVRGAFKEADNAKRTQDKARDTYDKRVAQEKHRNASKNAEALFKEQQKREEKLGAVQKAVQEKNYRHARKLMQDFDKEATKSEYKRSSLRNMLMGTRADLGPDGKPTTWGADLKGIGKTVGHSAIMMAAGKLGGAPGAMVAQNLQDKGLLAGAGVSAIGLTSYGIDRGLSAGQAETARFRSHGGPMGTLGVAGRGGFGRAMDIGEGLGLSRDQAAGYASQFGRAGLTGAQITGKGGAMRASALMQRLGLGEDSVGLLGQAGKQAGGGDAPARLLYRAVQAGMKSGLKEGRLPEFFQAVTSIIGGRGVGQKVDMTGVQDMLVGLGRAGFKGSEGRTVAGALDGLAKGQGSEFANAMSLRAAGLGGQGSNYFDAERKRQRGLFEMNPNGMDFTDSPEERFKTLYKQYDQSLGGNKDLISHQISQDTGGKLSMDAVDKLIDKMKTGGLGGGDVMALKTKTDTEKQLEKMGAMESALDVMNKRLDAIWRGLFGDLAFQTALRTITEQLPEMVKGIKALVTKVSEVFNFVTGKSPGQARTEDMPVMGKQKFAGTDLDTLFTEAQTRAESNGRSDRAGVLKQGYDRMHSGRDEDKPVYEALIKLIKSLGDKASKEQIIQVLVNPSLAGQIKTDVSNHNEGGKKPNTTRKT